MNRILLVILALLPLAALGCASKAEKIAHAAVMDYSTSNYAGARAKLDKIAEDPDRNFVLNNVRLGSTALAQYDLDAAEKAFLRAYEVQNSVGVNTGGRSLGATLVDEGVRIWKGEPFERAMTNFYLGVVYYMEHDYNNARAAFENAEFKLRDYGDAKADNYKEVDSNFALGLLMLAKCQQRVGREDDARKTFDRVAKLRPELKGLADFDWNNRSNVLLIVDYGYGPQKETAFDGSIVGFGPKPQQAGPIPSPAVTVDGRPMGLGGLAVPPVDLLALAQDRKWQSIDTIRVVKSAVGTGLMAGGLYEGTRHGGSGELALGLFAAGLLMKATSQGDVRQWEMLPRTVFVLPLHVPPGTHEITVSFPAVPGLSQTWRNLPVPAEGESTYYFRMQLYQQGPFTWPPPDPRVQQAPLTKQ